MTQDDSSRTQRDKKRVSAEIKELIEALAIRGWTAGQILEHLERQYKDSGLKVPTRRQVQRDVARHKPRSASGTWTLADAEGDESVVILETLAAVIEETAGGVESFSRTTAEWITRLHRAAPSLPPFERYVYALRYEVRAQRREPMGDLDILMAFAPWDDDSERYRAAINAKFNRRAMAEFERNFAVAFEPLPSRGADALRVVNEATRKAGESND